MCRAAIHNGADAVYFGVPAFNARGRAAHFEWDEFKEMVDLCHLYGVKVNLAFNVVIFENELPQVIEVAKKVMALGPDALIIQDLGLAKIVKKLNPEQRIHASTQMTVTNADAIEFLSDLQIDRFVLGRENSLHEMKLIREKTEKELEVFVHGALCVAYSGQCFTSEAIGGRSANRGQCAQSCRLDYELYVDDKLLSTGDKKYFVSPKDLMGLGAIEELKKLRINSFKVEGRLKGPEYVAMTGQYYSRALKGEKLNLAEAERELSLTYSRGFFTGWLNGVDHQQLVGGTYSAHRGHYLGKIKKIKNKKISLDANHDLKAGMGLLFVGSEEVGSKIFDVTQGEIELVSKNLALSEGMEVYLNSDEQLNLRLKKSFEAKDQLKRIPVKFLVQGEYRQPLFIKAIDDLGHEAYCLSQSFLMPALNSSLTEKTIEDELSSLSGSVFRLDELEIFLMPGLFLNHRELKDMRKTLVHELTKKRTERMIQLNEMNLEKKTRANSSSLMKMNLLLRSKDQVQAVIQQADLKEHIHAVILDFEFGKDYAEALQSLKSSGFKAGIATTRILKPQEYYNLNLLIRLKPDFILARNLGAIEYIKKNSQLELWGDFSLNVTNSITADYLLGKGLDQLTLSYDLNQKQLIDLLQASSQSEKLEVTFHQYMPEFHMEHCVFAAFLSKGSSFKDCGKPCEKHDVKLKDPYGNFHFLKADHECRNTFFKATPQSAAFLFDELKKQGLGFVRFEALNEKPHELVAKLQTYLDFLKGHLSQEDFKRKIAVQEVYGVNAHSLLKQDTYKDRKKS